MKKNTIIAALLAMMAGTAWAQPQYGSLDTVNRFKRSYFAQEWYTGCRQYIDGTERMSDHAAPSPNGRHLLSKEYTIGGRMEVRGLAVMVAIDVDFDTTYISDQLPLQRLPETLYLAQGLDAVPNTGLIFPRETRVIDSLRWDTIKPYVLRLPLVSNATADSDFMECYVYEALFSQPVIVDSVFYVVGTSRSNEKRMIDLPPGGELIGVMRFTNYPTVYSRIHYSDMGQCQQCLSKEWVRSFTHTGNVSDSAMSWHLANWVDDHVLLWTGPFFPIADMHNLTLNVSDPEAGHVEGAGLYPHLSTAQATAVPAMGYTFSHWSDGVTDNPRTIEMLDDVHLVAFFH